MVLALTVCGLVVALVVMGLFVFGLSETSSNGGLAATQAWLPLLAGIGLIASFALHGRARGRR